MPFDLGIEPIILGKLARQFGGVHPFSVLDTKSGLWQDRKEEWKRLGIKSELGRQSEDFALGNKQEYENRGRTFKGPCKGPNALSVRYKNNPHQDRPGGGPMPIDRGKNITNRLAPGGTVANTAWIGTDGVKGNEGEAGTSVFDPVLCEMMYHWFCPKGGTIWDQFAGGSVRGIVAAIRGFSYYGIDLRQGQIDANYLQWETVNSSTGPFPQFPVWHKADSVTTDIFRPVDFIFNCPPYGNLERYCDDPEDLSNMTNKDFDEAFRLTIHKAWGGLQENRFACWVVGDYRDKDGFYGGFPAKTVQYAEQAGFRLYNEAVLLNAIGSLQIRTPRSFRAGRKLGKCHQNVLIFWKGDKNKIQDTVKLIEGGE